MKYTSTRDKKLQISAAAAISKGISEEGGLFVPEEIPSVSIDFIEKLAPLDYIGRATAILALFLEDFSEEEISYCANQAYGGGKFSDKKTVPLVPINDKMNILELWKGPTCAFKDMALQILPHLLTASVKKMGLKEEILILVATSGDTGKAALDGFSDVEGVKILVFYPSEGVSPIQKLQMTTQKGENVGVCAIEGNFDDAQTGVKNIFADEEIKKICEQNNYSFSSANSINWGRLVPQIVYYFSAYCDMILNKNIKNGEKINIVVPTGNFGNILAAYFAKCMGLPVNKLICASNSNNVLTEFLNTGTYNRNREFYTTTSPSMDILISSNLERLLFLMNDRDDIQIREWFKNLAEKGEYAVGDKLLKSLKSEFAAGYCDDKETKQTIKDIFEKYNYLADTHTAVAIKVYNDYVEISGDMTPTVIASTASPYKFCTSVLSALKNREIDTNADEFAVLHELETLTNIPAPTQLSSLDGATPRFKQICKKEDMKSVVRGIIQTP